jgi:group I intron endonuclease
MSRGIIYLILNKQNGHKYVGNTTLAMNKEWVHHIERSKRMSSEPLHKAFRDLGVHNFMIKEIDECDESEFNEKTNYWIEQYKPEYNVNPAEGISASAVNVVKAEESMQVLRDPEPVPIKKQPRKTSPHLIPWNENTRGDGKKLGLKIRGKNLETGLCKDYNSAREAAIDVTGVPNTNGNILNAARSGIIAYGHKWQILEDKPKKRSVFGVNKKTEQIEIRYDSVNAAVRGFECTDKQGILKSLKNPGRYSWKGFYWFYVR